MHDACNGDEDEDEERPLNAVGLLIIVEQKLFELGAYDRWEPVPQNPGGIALSDMQQIVLKSRIFLSRVPSCIALTHTPLLAQEY